MKNLLVFLCVSIWLIFSCSENSCDCPGVDSFGNYKLSSKTYSEKIDLDSAVLADYGDEYRMVDWLYDIKQTNEISAFCESVGIQKGNHYFVKYAGERFFSSTRHYFASRFDGEIPCGYLAHDNIDVYYLCLGSWFDQNLQIILVKK